MRCGRKKLRWVFLLWGTLAVFALWLCVPPDTQDADHVVGLESPTPRFSETGCDGWPGTISEDPERMQPFMENEGWVRLLEGSPLLAASSFDFEAGDPLEQAGWVRAWTEVGLTLAEARRISLKSLQDAVSVRLEQPIADQGGREIYSFLRASVAVQAGEETDVSRWLEDVEQECPLGPAAEVLRQLAVLPLDDEAPQRAAARRWTRNIGKLARALPVADVGGEEQTGARFRVLAEWSNREALPSPETWRATLRPGVADYVLGNGEEGLPSVQLFDPSLYTVLSVMVLEQVVRQPMDSRFGRFFQVLAWEELEPRRAREEACELLEATPWNGDDEPLPYLFLGDWLDARDMAQDLARTCGRSGSASSLTEVDEVTEQFLEVKAWKQGCEEALVRRYGITGEDLVMGLRVYDGPARRKFIEPAMLGTCSASLQDDILSMQQGMAPEGRSRWRHPRATLRWIWVDVSRRPYEHAVQTARMLAAPHLGPGIYWPMLETLRWASGLLSDEAPGGTGR